MKRASVWGVLAVLALVVAVVATHHGGGPGTATGGGTGALPWERDLPTALARAGSEKKLVMVDFYTDWCGWCRRFDQNTLSDSNVQRALERVVSVRLNAEKDGREAAQRFNVDGYPTILFLNARGDEVGRIPGYLEPRPFLAEIENIMEKV
ncbi:MAG: thioredoxin family protein [Acidobacteriia bacterium]|nr:thioredoxin family protein [Terriglobia bacterium]